MIECNIFDVSVSIEDAKMPRIQYRVLTDLPAGTTAILDISRRYHDYEENECTWHLFGERVIFSKMMGDLNGSEGVLDIDSADKRAKEDFEANLSDYSSGIKGELSNEIFITYTVGLRQRLKAFGLNNCNLAGECVQNDGTINLVRGCISISIPISEENSPYQKN